ncbi:hypothetical protein EJM73_08400 [Clostridium botulinum]|uniref:hypothetical protein n=1 Tax=Clostridium botulinum TaxID=1491 RepID=UPI001375A6EF|nr:hypothetical protein [Clostridium botulinum]NCI19920.1 hypothetical protein [Clostridium botulinum]NCI35682.1 hypothetical protein [Clostridium botulinum]NCI71815.1 hypothetical protein [Clostridium botulinum]NDI38731.1 hypothetical protein [Clostridium botulinum]HCL4447083.1 hypothetical protein [Clostridium botulinum]
MGEDISFDKWTVYINGKPCDATITEIDFKKIISESQPSNIKSMELFNTSIPIKLTDSNIKNLINIYSKTKKFRIKKKLAKRINELSTKK